MFRFCGRYSGFLRVKEGKTVDLEFRIGFGMMVGSFGMTLGVQAPCCGVNERRCAEAVHFIQLFWPDQPCTHPRLRQVHDLPV